MEGRHRVGVLTELPEVLRQFGKDAAQVIARAGIEAGVLRNPENALSFVELGRLLQACVDETGCQHLGLLVGQRGSTNSLGLVGRLMQNAPTLGAALLDLCTNQPRYIRGAVAYLANQNETSYLGYTVHIPGMLAVEQLTDGAAAIGVNIIKELAGISPEAVYLTRRAPADVTPYRRCFGITPQFEMEQCAVVFPESLLARPVRGANHELRQILAKSVAEYWAVRKPTASEQVIRVLRGRVMFGGASLEHAAEELGLHPRTVNRRLESEGTSFRALLNQARFDVACTLLAGTKMPVTSLALVLGYSNTSAFTHAFQRWAGAPPTEWRMDRSLQDNRSPSLQ